MQRGPLPGRMLGIDVGPPVFQSGYHDGIAIIVAGNEKGLQANRTRTVAIFAGMFTQPPDDGRPMLVTPVGGQVDGSRQIIPQFPEPDLEFTGDGQQGNGYGLGRKYMPDGIALSIPAIQLIGMFQEEIVQGIRTHGMGQGQFTKQWMFRYLWRCLLFGHRSSGSPEQGEHAIRTGPEFKPAGGAGVIGCIKAEPVMGKGSCIPRAGITNKVR